MMDSKKPRKKTDRCCSVIFLLGAGFFTLVQVFIWVQIFLLTTFFLLGTIFFSQVQIFSLGLTFFSWVQVFSLVYSFSPGYIFPYISWTIFFT
jgi:hypothetical protein